MTDPAVKLAVLADTKKARQELKRFSDSARKTGKDSAQALDKAAVALTAIGAATTKAVVEYARFEKALAEVSTLLGGNTQKMAEIEKGAQALSQQFGTSQVSQVKAYYQAISAGAKDATAVMTEANKLALGGVTDIETAVDGLTTVMNAYGAQAGDATNVTGTFFAAMVGGKTTIGELSDSIGKVAPLAKAAGVGMDELFASISAVTSQGMKTSEAVSGLKAAISNIRQPTERAAKEAKRLGVEFDGAALRTKGLDGLLKEIQGSSRFTDDSFTKLFGSTEGLNSILALTTEGGQKFNEIMGTMADKAAITEEAVAKMSDTLNHKWNVLSASLGSLAIKSGLSVAQFLRLKDVMTGLSFLANSMSEDLNKRGMIALTPVGMATSGMFNVDSGDPNAEFRNSLNWVDLPPGFVEDPSMNGKTERDAAAAAAKKAKAASKGKGKGKKGVDVSLFAGGDVKGGGMFSSLGSFLSNEDTARELDNIFWNDSVEAAQMFADGIQEAADKAEHAMLGIQKQVEVTAETVAENAVRMATDVAQSGIGEGFAVMGDSIGAALSGAEGGLNNLDNAIGQVLAGILSQIGQGLIQMGLAAIAAGTLGSIVPFLEPPTGGPAGVAAGIAAVAVGTGLVVAGGALRTSSAVPPQPGAGAQSRRQFGNPSRNDYGYGPPSAAGGFARGGEGGDTIVNVNFSSGMVVGGKREVAQFIQESLGAAGLQAVRRRG